MDRAFAAQMHSCHRHCKALQLRLALKLPGTPERAVDRDRAREPRFSLDGLEMRQPQGRRDIEAGEVELGISLVISAEIGLPMQKELGRVRAGAGVVHEV